MGCGTNALFLALCSATAAAQGTLFSASHIYPTGGGPYGTALGDLDGDGNLDCAVADYNTDKVSVYLGTGAGTFVQIPMLTVGNAPRSVVIVDVNHDGKLELATANPGDDAVGVLLGDGLGGFGAASSFTTSAGTFPVWIDAGDLNGDTHVDLVTGNQSTNDLAVLLGDGAGNFSAPTFHNIGYSPERIRLADMNGDGNLDCVSASWGDYYVSVLLGDGNGNLNLLSSVVSQAPKGLEVADVDADGDLDVIVCSSQFRSASLHLGNGSGNLGFATKIWSGGPNDHPTAVVLADVSGDGRPDLVIANQATLANSLTVLVNAGGGSFEFAHTSPIPEIPTDVAGGDLNGDGFADVVTASYNMNKLRAHLSDGVGSWQHYCVGKANSLGCMPVIRGSGTPSASNVRPFFVRVSYVLDFKPGLFLYTVNGGHASIPFQNGTLCVGPSGIRRTPGQLSGGNPKAGSPSCSGAYELDFNAFAAGLAGGNPDPGLRVFGNTYQVQAWSRDPGFAAPNNSGLSPALDVTIWL